VSRENWPWLGLALLLLAGGWWAGHRLLVSVPADQQGGETFREWLWGTRSLDLAVQVGIIFVGALGIAALLPRGDEGLLGGGPLDGGAPGGEGLGGGARDGERAGGGLDDAAEG